MLVTEKGQVTIPKHIRMAAGVAPGSEVTFSLEGSKIVITPVGTSVKEDRRARLKVAAARVRGSFSADFKQLGADEIMSFIRGDESIKGAGRRGSRQSFQLRRIGGRTRRHKRLGGLHRRSQPLA
jgi:AbrB family looped-hinge helix DNA binding protein